MSDEMKEILRTLKAKSTRYKYCLKENISYNDESYEAYLLLDYITNLQEENDRLNNITNELEKDTIELMKSYKDVNAPRYDMCKHFIYKLKELKENNNE